MRQEINQERDNVILTKAVERAANALGLSQIQLERIIGLEGHGTSALNVTTSESAAGEAALILIRIYRALYDQVGADDDKMKYWMYTENRFLSAKPAHRIETPPGLLQVLDYLEEMLAKR